MTKDAHTPFGRENHRYTLSNFSICVRWSGGWSHLICVQSNDPPPFEMMNIARVSNNLVLLMHVEQEAAQNPSCVGATNSPQFSCASTTNSQSYFGFDCTTNSQSFSCANATDSCPTQLTQPKCLKSEFEVFQIFQYLTVTLWRAIYSSMPPSPPRTQHASIIIFMLRYEGFLANCRIKTDKTIYHHAKNTQKMNMPTDYTRSLAIVAWHIRTQKGK